MSEQRTPEDPITVETILEAKRLLDEAPGPRPACPSCGLVDYREIPDGGYFYLVCNSCGKTFTGLESVVASVRCPHCQRPDPHTHIIDRKGYIHG